MKIVKIKQTTLAFYKKVIELKIENSLEVNHYLG